MQGLGKRDIGGQRCQLLRPRPPSPPTYVPMRPLPPSPPTPMYLEAPPILTSHPYVPVRPLPPLCTHPVLMNIFTSRGSPATCPLMRVREWHVAMALSRGLCGSSWEGLCTMSDSLGRRWREGRRWGREGRREEVGNGGEERGGGEGEEVGKGGKEGGGGERRGGERRWGRGGGGEGREGERRWGRGGGGEGREGERKVGERRGEGQ